MSLPLISPEVTTPEVSTNRWMVTLFNDDVTPIYSVIRILIQATKCSQEEAAIETWEAHNFGKAQVHFASEEECRMVANVISSIGVKTEVSPEWAD
jgi:ATP-dependent Clp protease adaptor protein ClpS